MARVRALAALLIAAVLPLAAQESSPKPIDTDRPDVTDGTHTVAPGRMQLELGYTFVQARGELAGHTHSLPEALLRVGVGKRFEVRLGDNYLVQRGDGATPETSQGLDDLYVGTKVSLTDARGLVPAISVEAKTNIPTGSEAISAHRWLPGAALLLGWESDGPWSAGAEFLGTRAADGSVGVGSLSVQYQLTPPVQCYAEYYASKGWGSTTSAPAQHYVNGGVLVLLNSNVQVDARVGAGINSAADRYFLGLGFAIRR